MEYDRVEPQILHEIIEKVGPHDQQQAEVERNQEELEIEAENLDEHDEFGMSIYWNSACHEEEPSSCYMEEKPTVNLAQSLANSETTKNSRRDFAVNFSSTSATVVDRLLTPPASSAESDTVMLVANSGSIEGPKSKQMTIPEMFAVS